MRDWYKEHIEIGVKNPECCDDEEKLVADIALLKEIRKRYESLVEEVRSIDRLTNFQNTYNRLGDMINNRRAQLTYLRGDK